MAKIRGRKPKSSSRSYAKLFGNEELGNLMTMVQSATIASGNELEHMVNELVKNDARIIDDCNNFFNFTK